MSIMYIYISIKLKQNEEILLAKRKIPKVSHAPMNIWTSRNYILS